MDVNVIVLKVEDFVGLASSRGHSTYEQQADATGLGVATLHRLRNGGSVSSTAIARICGAYDVAFEDVFTFSPVAPKRVRPQRHGRGVRAAAA